ncbi:MAG: hypothetical protein NW226_25360 [Microscillaceae bacterium]|nr:hypothetical protein [Microscillaceae bacterium]
MKLKFIFAQYTIVFLLCNCQGGGADGDEITDSANFVLNYPEIREKIIKEEAKVQKIRKQRIQQGDTLAIEPEQLRDFLPKSFDGYAAEGDFVGSPYQLSGQSYANAEQDYVKGSVHIRITLCDYNGKEAQFAKETAYFASGIRIDDRQVNAGSVVFPGNIKGWEIFEKITQRAELNLAVSDRILIKIIANNQSDTEYIKKIAQKLNLKKLSQF